EEGDAEAGKEDAEEGRSAGKRTWDAEEGRSAGKRAWEAAGYRVVRVADREAGGSGGGDLTAPDGGRLLWAGGPGARPGAPGGGGGPGRRRRRGRRLMTWRFSTCWAIPVSSAGCGPGG